MNKKDNQCYFDKRAIIWDDINQQNEEIIQSIFQNAKVKNYNNILDVACGTGVLFPYYMKENISSLTAIDLSSEMCKQASQKYPQVHIICGDIEKIEFDHKFDFIMVYNAFPHFSNPLKLIETLSKLLNKDGRLCVVHGMRRKALMKHHDQYASDVSIELLELEEMVKLFELYFDVDIQISNDEMYQVSGTKR